MNVNISDRGKINYDGETCLNSMRITRWWYEMEEEGGGGEKGRGKGRRREVKGAGRRGGWGRWRVR